MTTYNYDKNGNLVRQVQANGRIDKYTYEDNQLVTLRQGQYVYDYSYDSQGERVKQVVTDTKDYHYDVWYEYTTPSSYSYVGEFTSIIDDLKVKVKDKEENGMVCDYTTQTYYGSLTGYTSKDVSRSKDAFYFKDPVETTYLLDRQQEYTQVIEENDKKYVYGTTLLKENKEDVVTGWNNSVVLKTDKDKTKKISYNDYGVNKDTTQGLGYNSEMQDSTGLIYLRARYYDPKTARFVQVDNNYDGEKDHIGSQNKYAYTLGNPYKYVDRDGNRAFQSILTKRIPAVLIGVMGIVNGVKSIFDKAKDIATNPPRGRSATNFPTNIYRSENRITPYKLPVAESSEAIKARQYKTSASFIASASCTKGEHKSLFAKFLDKTKEVGGNLWNGTKEVVKDAWDWAADKVSTVGGWIANNVDKILIGVAIALIATGAGLILFSIFGAFAGLAGAAFGLTLTEASTIAFAGGVSGGLAAVVTQIKGHFYGFTESDKTLVNIGLGLMSIGQSFSFLFQLGDIYKNQLPEGSGGPKRNLFDHHEEIAKDIKDINMKYSNGYEQNNSIDSILQSASYYDDPYEQVAAILRGITKHAFENGNKRTAFDTLKMLLGDFGINSPLSDQQIWDLIYDISEGGIFDVTDIAEILRGK